MEQDGSTCRHGEASVAVEGGLPTRRAFLARVLKCGAGLAAGTLLPSGVLELAGTSPARADTRLDEILKDAPVARYWISANTPGVSCVSCHGHGASLPSAGYTHPVPVAVQCRLCPRECVLSEGQRGQCRARINAGGALRSLVYGRPITEHIDPIEKKPFYHFLPGALAYSLATSGCPLHCEFCQNWEISQARPEDYETPFRSADEMARRVARARNGTVPVVAFTYNEPTVFCEYLQDIAHVVRRDGRRTVLISCGYVNPEPLSDILEVLDAVKFDLKGFDPEFYRKVTHAELEPVLRSIRHAARSGRHLELVNLVIPTLNDSEKHLTDLSRWVFDELGPDVPVHFTRFHPDYRLRNLPPTPVATLERARSIAMAEGIHYAYVGNVPGHPGNNTYCPTCHMCLIRRVGFFVAEMHIEDGKCPRCGTRIAGVWS